MRPYADSNCFSRFYLHLSKSEKAADLIEAARAEGDAPLQVTWMHRLEIMNYDLIHVACALILNCDEFWSFDPKASKLASLKGLRVT
jgi:hypothetical protein